MKTFYFYYFEYYILFQFCILSSYDKHNVRIAFAQTTSIEQQRQRFLRRNNTTEINANNNLSAINDFSPQINNERFLKVCPKDLISSNFEDGKINKNWKPFQVGNGKLRIRNEGASGTAKSLECYNRRGVGGPSFQLDPSCLKEGQQYIFIAKVKVTDQNDQPVYINKYSRWGNPRFLAFSILSDHPRKGVRVFNSVNQDPSRWRIDDWNTYRAIFTITDEVDSKRLLIFFRGPQKLWNIILDEVTMEEYYPPEKTCDKPLVSCCLDHPKYILCFSQN